MVILPFHHCMLTVLISQIGPNPSTPLSSCRDSKPRTHLKLAPWSWQCFMFKVVWGCMKLYKLTYLSTVHGYSSCTMHSFIYLSDFVRTCIVRNPCKWKYILFRNVKKHTHPDSVMFNYIFTVYDHAARRCETIYSD